MSISIKLVAAVAAVAVISGFQLAAAQVGFSTNAGYPPVVQPQVMQGAAIYQSPAYPLSSYPAPAYAMPAYTMPAYQLPAQYPAAVQSPTAVEYMTPSQYQSPMAGQMPMTYPIPAQQPYAGTVLPWSGIMQQPVVQQPGYPVPMTGFPVSPATPVYYPQPVVNAYPLDFPMAAPVAAEGASSEEAVADSRPGPVEETAGSEESGPSAAATETTMPQPEPYVNNDPLIALQEPYNDGMARFRLPADAEAPVSYKVNDMEGTLNPGECLAIPAGEEFTLTIMPAGEAEAMNPDVTSQGEYIFAGGDIGLTIEDYTPPAPQTPPAPAKEEQPSTDSATSSDESSEAAAAEQPAANEQAEEEAAKQEGSDEDAAAGKADEAAEEAGDESAEQPNAESGDAETESPDAANAEDESGE